MIIILILQEAYGILRDEIIGNINVMNNNSSSFKYKSNLIGQTDADEVNKKKKM